MMSSEQRVASSEWGLRDRRRRGEVILIVFCVLISAFRLHAQQPSVLQSDGVIYNYGTIKILGDAAIAQDTILGIVSYERNNADSQMVSHNTYSDLRFSGVSVKKMLDASRPVEADSMFWSETPDVVIDLIPASWIRANRTVRHEGSINPGLRVGRFVLMGTENQDVSGQGSIPILELNNAQGATITRAGGLQIVERLDLQVGTMSNTAADNIAMQDGAWIWRDDDGFLANEPVWNNRYHLRYYGDAPMLQGNEAVRNTTAIGKLIQDDLAGLTMTHDVTVNDSLRLQGHIFTEESDAVRHELSFSPTFDPEYVNWWPEVNGTLVRTTLVLNQTQRMNSHFTTISFTSFANSQGQPVTRYAVRSKPKTVPLPLTDITFKVERFLQLEARNAAGDVVPDSSGWDLTFGYTWRNREIDPIETPAVIETIPQLVGQEADLVLMRYDPISQLSYNEYGLHQNKTTATGNPLEAWRFGTTELVKANGDFAIGLSTGPIWVLNTRLLMEGPLRTYGENFTPTMATDLATRGLIPSTPPDIYPYNLDPDRATVIAPAIGDTVVDWVTVEFRTSPTSSAQPLLVETLLLLNDGRVVDPFTLRPAIIADIPAGQYNIAVRHRNHLAVITEDKVLVSRSNIGYVVDFASGVGVFGGAAAQKLVGTANGQRHFGLIAGEVEGADDLRRSDYNLVWNDRNTEAYTLFDTDLNGIVTTRDLNVSWNNRERTSVAPR